MLSAYLHNVLKITCALCNHAVAFVKIFLSRIASIKQRERCDAK